MVALWPVPGYAITYMQKIQKDRMKLVRLLAASMHANPSADMPVDGRTRSGNLRMYALSVQVLSLSNPVLTRLDSCHRHTDDQDVRLGRTNR